MATIPTAVTRAPKQKKGNGKGTTKHTITLSFEDKYSSLYDELVRAADSDDRNVSQYVLLFLRDNHEVTKPTESAE